MSGKLALCLRDNRDQVQAQPDQRCGFLVRAIGIDGAAEALRVQK
jgi:hypothetical protein